MNSFTTHFSTARGIVSQATSTWWKSRGNGASATLLDASDQTNAMVLRALRTSPDGLTEEEVLARREIYGPNTVAHERPTPWPILLLQNLKNPFILVLLLLGVVSYATDDLRGALVVSVMVVLSVVMRFLQEFRSSRAAEALRAMVRTTATITRRYSRAGDAGGGDGDETLIGERREVPFEELVPGDIVHLSAGDLIPADVRLLSSKDLMVSQSVLTGEAMPVEKYDTLAGVVEKSAERMTGQPTDALDRNNLGFMGTTVVSGTGVGAVIRTGRHTVFGSLAKSVIGHRSLTSFDRGVNGVTWVLIRFMLVMVPVVFLINGIVKGDFTQAFLFAIAVAVGLTPEMLPMVVTANLAKGAVTMAKQKVIVKRLNAIQNLGAMDVLCTDKTGTLTQDRVILEKHRNVYGEVDLRVLELAYLNSYYQTGLKNLLDRAVLAHGELDHELDVLQHYEKIDEIPFDFARRRMSVVVANQEGAHILICKGAVEEVLSICTRVDVGNEVVFFHGKLRDRAEELAHAMNEDGFRVVAVAHKTLTAHQPVYRVADEQNLIFSGFIAFLDPPKETAAAAVSALNEHGVRVVVLTGDNEIVTRQVARQVGLPADQIVLGTEVEHMSDHQLVAATHRVSLFAKLHPLQKARIVRAFQSEGHTVGYLGDGINDAAALRDSDVGISVDTATDIARESADIILLEKSLMVLETGVLKGRAVYGNIIKYIKMTASSNFGNVFSVLVASAFLPFLPMLPVQLLIQNLLYDFSQLSLPWDRMDPEFLRQPRKWDTRGIARFMVWIGPISSVFDITTFLLLWFVFQANGPARQAMFQSGWFIEGLLSQTLIVHMIRTERIPFVQSSAALPVLLLTSAIMAIGIWLPFTGLGATVGMVHLPVSFFPWLLATLLAYSLLTQIVKQRYIKRYGVWL